MIYLIAYLIVFQLLAFAFYRINKNSWDVKHNIFMAEVLSILIYPTLIYLIYYLIVNKNNYICKKK